VSEEAIYQGAPIRFRPVMMTTLSVLAAAFPIALGLGAGGETRPYARDGRNRRSALLPDRDPVYTPVTDIDLDKAQAALCGLWKRA